MKNENLADLNFRSVNIPVYSLLDLIKNKEFKLEYFIDKQVGAWSNSKKSQFIESFLIRAPIQSMVIHDGVHYYSIIDGMERISAINEFFNNEFELIDLKLLHELNGKKYSDLIRPIQRRIEESRLHMDYISSFKQPDLAIRIASNYL